MKKSNTLRNWAVAIVTILVMVTGYGYIPNPNTHVVSTSYSFLADESAEYTSIQNCVDNVQINDTCEVLGNYNYKTEKVVISKLSVKLIGSEATTVQCINITANNVVVSNTDVVNCPTYGITISGDNALVENGTISKSQKDGILLMQSSDSANIRNIIITEAGQSCVEVRGTNHTIDKINCSGTVQVKTGQSYQSFLDADCFRFFGSGHVFKNNYCDRITFGTQPTGNNVDPHIDGFQTWGDTSRGIAHDITFDGNIITGYGRGSDAAFKGVQLEGGGTRLTFKNNTFITTLGVLCTNAMTGLIFDHNTFVGDKNDSGSWGLNANRCGNPVISNNIFAYHPNGSGHIQGTAQTSNNCVWQSGNPANYAGDLRANPMFVNESLNDYRLQSGSPCAGRGVIFSGTPLPPSSTPSLTKTPTITFTPSLTSTKTSTPTTTLTVIPSATKTVTSTSTVITPSTTFTLSNTPTPSNTPTSSITPSVTSTRTPTSTATITPTKTITRTPTITSIPTITPIPTQPPFNRCDYNRNGRIDGFREWICVIFS